MVLFSKCVHTSLASRYWNNRWSHAENISRYGHLASREGVGGNWKIEIEGVGSEVEFEKSLMAIKSLLDHRCLFVDIPEFIDQPSTLESVTLFLGKKFLDRRLTSITVHESERLSCSVRADGLMLQLKVMNLCLTVKGVPDESGLMTSREQVTQSVIEAYDQFALGADLNEEDWARSLFENLERRVTGLYSLRVDLGAGQYIVVP